MGNGAQAARHLILSVFLFLSAAAAHAACRDDVVELRGDWGQTRFGVVVADTPELRAQGLMFVEQMSKSTGMLFVYERPQIVSFWMRNTLIPLDMIFADATGIVRKVHVNAIPGDETAIPGGNDIQFVLEINGGLSPRIGIVPGSQLRHPSVPQDSAAWPCAETGTGATPLTNSGASGD